MSARENRLRPLAVLLAVLMLAIALAGCSGKGDKTFEASSYPFSFDYPSTWTLTRTVADDDGAGARRALTVALQEPYDQVSILQYRLKKTLPRGANAFRPEIDRIVTRLVKQARGKAGRAKPVKYGGIPGYQYVISYPAGSGTRLSNTMTFLFRGHDEFQIGCQSAPENRDELMDGCQKILGTLEFK